MSKLQRYTRAIVVSQSLTVYRICKTKFFDRIYDKNIINLFKDSSLILKTWREKYFNEYMKNVYFFNLLIGNS